MMASLETGPRADAKGAKTAVLRQGRALVGASHRAGPLLLALFLACTPTAVEPTPEPECTRRSDCAGGDVCLEDGRCGPCSSSGQCLLREYCDPQAGTCAPRPGWSDACELNGECPAGAFCHQGSCVQRDAVHLCPDGAASTCPTGQRCNAANLVCEEDLGCLEPGDCGPAETCNPGSRRCVPRCDEAAVDSGCGLAERCHDARCVQCVEDADCGPQLTCDAAGRCGEAPRCYSDRDCSIPLVCHLATGACLAELPPCNSDEHCAPDRRCQLATGACVPRDCVPDTLEPNDTLAQAFNVTASLYGPLTLCQGDVDHFAITLARGDQLGVRLDADAYAESTFSTRVLDAQGRTVASGRLLVSYVAPSAGAWYVAVSTTDREQSYDVRFLLSRGTPCDDDDWEPNDLPTQPTPVNGAGTLDGAVCPQDQDHYAVTVPALSALRVSLDPYVSAQGLLELCVFDGPTALGCSDALERAEVLVPATQAPRSLVVRVRGVDPRAANTYTLKVEFP